MIQVRDLTVRFGPVEALHAVNLDVAEGECVLVTGPSGCGKSTLSRVLTGLIPNSLPAEVQGDVRIAGMRILESGCSMSTVPEIARRVGVVFQNPSSQLFHLTVEDEISFGPHNLGMAPEQVRERVEWAIEAVGLDDLRACKPVDLSGGQKQRVAIAAALAMQPQVLVLDEPTASLDIQGTNLVIDTLMRLRESLGVTIVLFEHRLAEVARLAGRAILIEEGRIVRDGELQEVFEDRRTLRRLGLRRLVNEPAHSWERLLSPDGHMLAGIQPLLSLKDVEAGYDGQAVIRGVNLDIYPGEFAALVGENGAGKSTLGLVAAGLLRPRRGEVRFQGGKRFKPGLDIALLFQNPLDQLFTDQVDEEIAFGPLNYDCFDAQYHEQILEEADLAGLRARRPLALSSGQQQRTALAACLSLRPRLLILDEPTLGQDWGHLQRLMDFLTSLNRQGTAILLITHDYKLVYRYSQRVIYMTAGRIVLDGHLNQKENV